MNSPKEVFEKYNQDLQYLLDKLNEKYNTKLTKIGVGDLFYNFLRTNPHSYKYDDTYKTTEDEILEDAYEVLENETVHDNAYKYLWDIPDDKDQYPLGIRKLVDELDRRRKLLLEFCPHADRMIKGCRK